MSNEAQAQAEFERLLGSLLNASIDHDQALRLERLMRGHPGRIQRYLELVEIDVMLETESAFASDDGDLPSLGVSTEGIPSSRVGSDSESPTSVMALSANDDAVDATGPDSPGVIPLGLWRVLRSGRLAAAALLVAFLGSIGWWVSVRGPAFSVFLAEEAKFDESTSTFSVGDDVKPDQSLQLASGRLGLRTRSGVLLVAEGPVELRPLEGGGFVLDRGKIRARVPHDVDDFVVHCPGIKVTDLGTEFGVQVSATGEVQTEVYDGLVRMELVGSKQASPLELAAGWAGVGNARSPARLDTFEIGGQQTPLRWWAPPQTSVSAMLMAKPAFLHSFDHPAAGKTLSSVNASLYPARLSGDAKLVAAGPANSMESQGRALELGGNGYAEIPIGFAAVEQSGAYTFSCWMKAWGEGDQSVFLATNHLGPDQRVGPQLRIRADGRLEHHLFSPTLTWGENAERQLQRSDDAVSFDSWRHVVVTAATSGDMMLFVDGRPIAAPVRVSNRISASYPTVLLGSKAPKLNFGGLEGLIDDFALFSRQLSDSEVGALYEASCSCYEALE